MRPFRAIAALKETTTRESNVRVDFSKPKRTIVVGAKNLHFPSSLFVAQAGKVRAFDLPIPTHGLFLIPMPYAARFSIPTCGLFGIFSP